MPVSSSVVRRSNDEVEIDVIATADADTVTASIPHGLGLQRPTCFLMPLQQDIAALCLWAVTTLDGTDFVLTKDTAVGSGDAAASVRAVLKRAR